MALTRGLVSLAAAACAAAGQRVEAEVQMTRVQLDAKFRAEGVAVADVDGDQKQDIIAGALWYRAPDWKPFEITAVKEYDGASGYSDSFCCFADDLNRDGRPDLIVVGFPGLPVRLYENPGPDKLGSHWKEYQAFPSCTNESPQYLDIDGDGRRELICGFEPEERMAWFRPGANISDPWTCHPFSGPKAVGAQRYYHGLGLGDVNKDNRPDVIVPHGWYEAPEDRKSPDWKLHPISPSPPSAHLYVHDFDQDGDQDLLGSSAHDRGVWWYEQKTGAEGKIEWAQHEIDREHTQTHAMMLADLNKDGLPDFVTGKRFWAHGPRGDVDPDKPAVLLWYELGRKDGKPTWTRHVIDSDSGVGIQFEVTDVNGDSLQDIVVSNKKGVFYFEQKKP
jgi:hypothetical protein